MLPPSFFSTIAQIRFCRISEMPPSTSMPHTYLAEAITTINLVIQSAVTAFMLAYAPASRLELLEWTLLPMLGATIAAGGAFCLNTQQEVRRIVIGRCAFALMVGVVGPRLLSMMHPWITEVLADPLLKVGAGFLHGFIAYILSWPLVKSSYNRAAPIAEQLIQAGEARLVQQISKQVASDAAVVAVGVAQELAAHPNSSPSQVTQVIANNVSDNKPQ